MKEWNQYQRRQMTEGQRMMRYAAAFSLGIAKEQSRLEPHRMFYFTLVAVWCTTCGKHRVPIGFSLMENRTKLALCRVYGGEVLPLRGH